MVLHFATCESIRKTGKIQILCLRIVLDDCDSDYDVLLRESGKAMAEIKHLRVAAIEIFKKIILFETVWEMYSETDCIVR